MKTLGSRQIVTLIATTIIVGYLVGFKVLPRPEFVGCTAEKHQHLLNTVTCIYRVLAGSAVITLLVGFGFLVVHMAKRACKSKFWKRDKIDRESQVHHELERRHEKAIRKLADRKAKIVYVSLRHRLKFRIVQFAVSLVKLMFSDNVAIGLTLALIVGYIIFSNNVFNDLCITTFLGWLEFVLPAFSIGLALLFGFVGLLTQIRAQMICKQADAYLSKLIDPTKNSASVLYRAKFLQALQEGIKRNKNVSDTSELSIKTGGNKFRIDNKIVNLYFSINSHRQLFFEIELEHKLLGNRPSYRINRYHVPASTPAHTIQATLLRDVSGLIDDLHVWIQESSK